MSRGFSEKSANNPGGFDVLVGATIASSVFYLVLVGDPNNNNWRRHPVLAVVDMLLIVLAISGAIAGLRRASGNWWKSTGSIERSLGALFVVLVGSAVAHPSAMGLVSVSRLAGMIVLALTIGRSRETTQRMVTIALVATTIFEAVVVSAQRLLGHAIGLGALGELVNPFNGDPSTGAPSGTLFYPYPLAGWVLLTFAWCLVMRSRLKLSSGVCVAVGVSAGVIVGLSQGVAGLIGAVALLVFSTGLIYQEGRGAALSGRMRLMVPTVVCAFALVLAGLVSPSGWAAKAVRTTQGVEAAGNGRVGMLKEAIIIVKRFPILGVGPGNFMATRDTHPEIAAVATEDQPVHNVPLLILTEGGLPAGLALLGVVAAVVIGALRRKPLATLAVVSGLSGFLMFDLYLWWFGIGAVQLGVMFGLLILLSNGHRRVPEPTPLVHGAGINSEFADAASTSG
jgi:O-Antigen ligase